jgi:hypothetical protein
VININIKHIKHNKHMSDTIDVPTDGGDGIFWDGVRCERIIEIGNISRRLISPHNKKQKNNNNIFVNNNYRINTIIKIY